MKLGELCDICSGGTPKRSVSEYWINGLIPWVKIGDITKKYVSTTEEKITEKGLNGSSAKMLEPGTLLYSIFASIGAVGILEIPATTNQAIAGLSIKNDSISPDYLFHFLKSRKTQAKSSGRGAAQNNINLSILREMKVPVPHRNIQDSVVRQLEIILEQIEAAETTVELLDALVKSRFVEMFGDPVDDKRWPEINLGKLCLKLGSGATPRGGKSAYKSEGLPLIRSMNVHNGYFEWKDLAHIDNEQAAKLKSVELMKGDVLLNITGASVARSCILPDELAGGCVNQHVSIVRVDQNRMLPIFLNAVITSDSYQDFLLNGSKMAGATREAITKSDLEKMMVPLPPLPLQQEFAAFADEVDKSRFAIEQGIEKLHRYNEILVMHVNRVKGDSL